MVITVTWSITDMTHVDADGGVVKAYWSCAANSDGDPSYSAQNQSKIICTYDASAAGYIPYASLTESDVLGWVWDSMATDDITAAEAKAAQEANVTTRVQNQIDAAATTATGMPWAAE
jgi:hypothetical protein